MEILSLMITVPSPYTQEKTRNCISKNTDHFHGHLAQDCAGQNEAFSPIQIEANASNAVHLYSLEYAQVKSKESKEKDYGYEFA
jgi:hypothetical protein